MFFFMIYFKCVNCFVVLRVLQEKICWTHIDVLHVSYLTPDGVKLLGRLTDVVTVLQQRNS